MIRLNDLMSVYTRDYYISNGLFYCGSVPHLLTEVEIWNANIILKEWRVYAVWYGIRGGIKMERINKIDTTKDILNRINKRILHYSNKLNRDIAISILKNANIGFKLSTSANYEIIGVGLWAYLKERCLKKRMTF